MMLKTTMQDFFDYALTQPELQIERQQALQADLLQSATVAPPMLMDEPDYDELFSYFDRDDLPEGTMSAEMADGFMTACAVGPHMPPTYEWLTEIFAQHTLPICPDPVVQERLLQLLLLRMRDIRRRIAIPRALFSMENIFLPLRSDLEPGELIVPYTFDTEGYRNGRWELKDWAQGFRMRAFEDPRWQPMVDHPEHVLHFTGVLLYDQGHNSEQPSMQIENEPKLMGALVSTLRSMYEFWSQWRADHPGSSYDDEDAFGSPQLPYWRASPKVGRNDPCPCGSGQKYKKCHGG